MEFKTEHEEFCFSLQILVYGFHCVGPIIEKRALRACFILSNVIFKLFYTCYYSMLIHVLKILLRFLILKTVTN